MAIIVDILTAITAVMAAFIGHIAAHDFVEFTPKLSRTLIRRATKRLPNRERARYREEWLADLNERVGVSAKFKHAFGCMISARRMSIEAARSNARNKVMRFQIPGVGEIEIDGATTEWIMDAVRHTHSVRRYRFLGSWVRTHYVYTRMALWYWQQQGSLDINKASRFVDMIAEAKDLENMKVWINGELVSPPQSDDKPM
jgi:hypothetical protein